MRVASQTRIICRSTAEQLGDVSSSSDAHAGFGLGLLACAEFASCCGARLPNQMPASPLLGCRISNCCSVYLVACCYLCSSTLKTQALQAEAGKRSHLGGWWH